MAPAVDGRGHPGLSAEVVVPLATVEPARAKAALLETGGRNHTGTDHSGPASRGAPCRRAPSAVRGAPAFRRDIPFLRLLLVSKGGEAVEVVILSSHDIPPWMRLAGRADKFGRLTARRPAEAPRRPTMRSTSNAPCQHVIDSSDVSLVCSCRQFPFRDISHP